MTKPTHVDQINGHTRGAFLDDLRPYREELSFVLNRMNGTSFWAYSLWRAPEGADLLHSIPLSPEYMQCAGTAEALAVEVRYLDADGVPHQYAVSRPGAAAGEPSEIIYYDDARHHVTVYPTEVFTADEAAAIFYQYFLTDKVPQPYVLRDIHLESPASHPSSGTEPY